MPQQELSIPTLYFVPSTEQECTLSIIIQRLEIENELLCQRAIELQAANVLNEACCAVLREQLAFKEEKGKKKKTVSGWLMGDGMPVLLTGDDFYERVVQWEKSQEEAAAEKTNQRAVKEEWNEEKEKWKRDKTTGLNVL
ncbi:hypothetical protein IW261DRAFT_1346607 [Armillaria novae-zelandiae]|uniref:Uncharacterized protein n=1 Tax=Armillaria novae-zelandiae TaxID=153914 RepID=A0AA39NJ30_9AGAR|nr:hypothetical protein IW261DRAFT_1346607 [Armillaria novae-zelandiae]